VRDVRYTKSGKITHQVVYGVTSFAGADAGPKRLLNLHRRHWAIENKRHFCRDVTFHEKLATWQLAPLLRRFRTRSFTAIASARLAFVLCRLRPSPWSFTLPPDFACGLPC